jgi:hypothetical protein
MEYFVTMMAHAVLADAFAKIPKQFMPMVIA